MALADRDFLQWSCMIHKIKQKGCYTCILSLSIVFVMIGYELWEDAIDTNKNCGLLEKLGKGCCPSPDLRYREYKIISSRTKCVVVREGTLRIYTLPTRPEVFWKLPPLEAKLSALWYFLSIWAGCLHSFKTGRQTWPSTLILASTRG